jgi:integrase
MRPYKIPRYPSRKHSGGQARITDRTGYSIYLGAFGSPESVEEYNRTVATLALHKGVFPRDRSGSTVGELIDRYLGHAANYYVKRGKPTAGYRRARSVLAELRAMYGSLEAVRFRQADLKVLRSTWESKHTVGTCNQYAAVVVGMYAWAASEDLIAPEAHAALRVVLPLKPGRCRARVNPPVRPATQEEVGLVLADLDARTPAVAAMVRVQRLCAMRPQEVCYLRPQDLRDRDKPVWKYVVPPQANKKAHESRIRWVPVGPRAQAILRPFLEDCKPEAAVFRPRDYPGRRRSKTWPGYCPNSYCDAIRRSCARVGVSWHVNQLRHAGATTIRARADLDTARATLGHSDAATTSDYAEQDWSKVVALALEIG